MKKSMISLLAPALGLLLMLAWPAFAPAQQNGAEAAPAAPEEAVVVTDLPSAAAAPGPEKTAAPDPGSSPGFSLYSLDMVKALSAFILVLVLLVLALKALGRLSRYRGGGLRGRGSIFELRGIQALDSRKFLAAVEVEGRVIVVGVTPDRITPVAHWPLNQDADDEGLDFSGPLPMDREAAPEFKLPAEEPRLGRRGGGRLGGRLDINVADPEEPKK